MTSNRSRISRYGRASPTVNHHKGVVVNSLPNHYYRMRSDALLKNFSMCFSGSGALLFLPYAEESVARLSPVVSGGESVPQHAQGLPWL